MNAFRLINKQNYVVLLLALFNVSIHLLVMNNLEYHRDELLYFTLGEHPDFGYATVPPMIGWIAWLMQNMFGYSLFAVRLFPALLSGLMVILVSAIAKELGGSTYSRIVAAIGMIVSGFGMRTFGLYMPVAIDVVFWTLIFYLIIKYLNTSSDRFLIFLGLAMGLSLLNKYLIGVLFIALIIVIPFTQNRKIFNNKYLWLGVFVTVIVFLPNLLWQFSHRLPVINHLSELERTQLDHVEPIGFLIDQLMMPAWAGILAFAGFFYLFLDKEASKFRFLGIVSVLVILILLILRGKSYYTIGIYPFLIAAGAVSYDKQIKRLWIRIALPLVLIMLTIPMLPFGLQIYKSHGLVRYFEIVDSDYGIKWGRRFEDGSIHSLPQDYSDMLGWEELTAITAKAYQTITDKNASFIYCENYGQAGAISIIGKKYGLPEAVSFNESFRYWFPRSFNPDITCMIYINNDVPGEDVKNLFRRITVAGKISNPDAREYGTTVYICEDPVESFNKFWKERTALLRP